jgi:predicted GTPase
MARDRILILGAAGRDFHTFNTCYRDDPTVEVVAFTAQQIPHIEDRRYPPELAGALYPEGISIEPEDRLESLIAERGVDRCVLAYSDLSYVYVMNLASRVNVAGAAFELPDPRDSMLESDCPVVAVCAARTGAGKSPTSRAVVRLLREAGAQVGVIRHPMPYGDLRKQRVQRFASSEDLIRHDVTIEEREEYEPHIAAGTVVWAGVEYAEILKGAQQEADVILWDGGNNDTPFVVPKVHITVVDPHRAGHELSYYPGENNVRMADVILVNKVDTADPKDVRTVIDNVRRINPTAVVLQAECPPVADDPDVLRGREVLAIEDGPTVSHGGMAYGAAAIASRRLGARLRDPRAYAAGEIHDTFGAYPHLDTVLPAMGYGAGQIADLEATIRAAVADGVEAVAIGTPIDLARLVDIPVPHTRVRYEIEPAEEGALEAVLAPVLEGVRAGAS